jgi:hypothetical protein
MPNAIFTPKFKVRLGDPILLTIRDSFLKFEPELEVAPYGTMAPPGKMAPMFFSLQTMAI